MYSLSRDRESEMRVGRGRTRGGGREKEGERESESNCCLEKMWWSYINIKAFFLCKLTCGYLSTT